MVAVGIGYAFAAGNYRLVKPRFGHVPAGLGAIGRLSCWYIGAKSHRWHSWKRIVAGCRIACQATVVLLFFLGYSGFGPCDALYGNHAIARRVKMCS